MARLTSRFYGPRAGFLAALALNLSAYYTAAAGTFALPDGPLLFFWLLTLDRLAVALDAPGRPWPWVAVGLAWGGALLSKYHAVFLPAGTLLYLLLEPSARPWLRRPGPYLAVVVGLLVFSPVIWWNATHEWISFAFQGGRALGAVRFRPETLAGGDGRAGGLPASLDLGPAGGDPGPAGAAGCAGDLPRRPTGSCSASRSCLWRRSRRWPAPARSCRTGRSWASCRCSRCSAGRGTRA